MGIGTTPVSDQNFEAEVVKSSGLVLVDFWAEWCGPCRQLGPKLEEIATELGAKVKIVKLNVDESPETAAKFAIRSIPTMIVFKAGKPVEQVMGNLPKDNILSFLQKHI